MDLKAGLLSLTFRQMRLLRQLRGETDLAVCVGDVLLLLLAGNFLRRPIIFLPTAKSDYTGEHWPAEIQLIRRFCVKVFPRDAVTAESHAGHGLPAEFAGNVMMDSLDFHGTDLAGAPGAWTIGVLPGSRQEAYDNLEDIAQVAVAFDQLDAGSSARRQARYLVALAGGLDFAEVARRLSGKGWSVIAPSADEAARGVVGHLEMPGRVGIVRFTIAKGRFADILAASDAVVGLAGTGNEQAVGLGKPVVAFVGRGPQFTPKFADTQKRLLGEAVALVDSEPRRVASEILDVLTNEARRSRMAEVGRERMGQPGATKRIIAEIVSLLGR
jgi:uncharacterized protein (TIGR03492 family)